MSTSSRDLTIRTAYASGRSLRQIADDFGLSHEGIRKVLRRQGVTLRGRASASARAPAAPTRVSAAKVPAELVALSRAWIAKQGRAHG